MTERWWTEPGAFRLVAQPIVDLSRGLIAGYEVLTRFPALNRPPDQVFAEANDAKVGDVLEAAIIERALLLKDTALQNNFISINVDPHHLDSAVVRETLAGRDLSGVVFELTEHRHFGDLDRLTEVTQELRKRGATIAVDDAGSGYAGLQQLLMLRPQLIKLDRALVSNLDRDAAKRALISMLGDFAGRLDAWILGEGVETEGELLALKEIGVPLVQGYYLAKPADPWTELRDEAKLTLVSAPTSHRRTTLWTFVHQVDTIQASSSWSDPSRACVRLDAHARPLQLRLELPGGQTRSEQQLLRVNVLTHPTQAVQRALLRPPALRWDPLVIVDDDGGFLGLARIEEIVEALLERAPASSQGSPRTIEHPF